MDEDNRSALEKEVVLVLCGHKCMKTLEWE